MILGASVYSREHLSSFILDGVNGRNLDNQGEVNFSCNLGNGLEDIVTF